MQTNWSLKISDWTKSNVKSLEFIHSKANEAFSYTTNVADKISSRAFTFISILVPIISLIIGLLGNQIVEPTKSIPSTVLIVALIICVPSVLSLGALIWMIFPKKFMHAGREPKNIAIPQVIQDDSFTQDEQYLALLIGEIEGLQKKISTNEELNNKRLKILKWVLRIISISLFLSIIILFYYSFFIVS
jgi:hypothetical protein